MQIERKFQNNQQQMSFLGGICFRRNKIIFYVSGSKIPWNKYNIPRNGIPRNLSCSQLILLWLKTYSQEYLIRIAKQKYH